MKKTLISLLLLLAVMLALCACAVTEPAAATPAPAMTTEEPATIVIVATPVPETPAPAETAEPDPSPEPSADPVDDRAVFRVDIDTVYRSAPDKEDASVLGRLSAGSRVRCEEDRGDFLLVELSDGRQVWVDPWYLTAEDPELAEQRDQDRLQALTARAEFVPISGEQTYFCTAASGLNCRAEPSVTGEKVTLILKGTRVTVYGREGSFYLCRLPNSKLCYCYEDYLSNEASYAVYPGAVDLRVFLPGAEFELLFASPNNITGHAMYAPIPLLEEGVAYKLLEAYQIFREDGYTIKIYDAYRPRSAQIELFNIVQDANYIADPYHGGSWHQRGWAVDMSLIDLSTGEELEMPTPMHTFSKEAGRASRDSWSEEVRRNVDYMTQVMTSVGFQTIATEWWHFEYLHSGHALDMDIDLSALPLYPVSDYTTPY